VATKRKSKPVQQSDAGIERVLDKLDQHTEQLKDLHVEVAKLKTRAQLWGGASGLVAGVVLAATKLLGDGR
jgi:hypothetical protein